MTEEVLEKEEDFTPEIRHVRLTNGDEIFGHVEEDEKAGGILVHRPMLSVRYQNPDGSIGVGVTSYLPFQVPEKQVCFLKDEHIVTLTPVAQEVENFYHFNCHFSIEADEERLDAIGQTNFALSNQFFDEEMTKRAANGAILGPASQAMN